MYEPLTEELLFSDSYTTYCSPTYYLHTAGVTSLKFPGPVSPMPTPKANLKTPWVIERRQENLTFWLFLSSKARLCPRVRGGHVGIFQPPTHFPDCTPTGGHIKAFNVVLWHSPSWVAPSRNSPPLCIRVALLFPPLECFASHLSGKTGMERKGLSS